MGEEIMSNGITIDFDTADRITLLVLKDQLKYLRKELEDFKNGKWVHPEDVVRNAEIIAALELLIPYYGGTVV
jgi:hypothetical protein